MKCLTCQTKLIGRQTKFCSRKCKAATNNYIYQKYDIQKKKGYKRRLELLRLKGGKCEICGYSKNSSALCFHHMDPSEKEIKLSMRECSNFSWTALVNEVNKCQILCSNCHLEHHHPETENW